MNIHHFAGRITTGAIMQQPTIVAWAGHWLQQAENAEQRGNELVVFEVPKKGFSHAVATIEQGLRHEFELLQNPGDPALEDPINLFFLQGIMMPPDGA